MEARAETPPPADAHVPARGAVDWLLLVVGLAATSRAVYALSKSLVLDEFHSRFHGLNRPLGSFMERLLQDNHPPLSFLLIGTSAGALGDSPLALRMPAILCGLLEIALVARLARRLGGSPRMAAVAAAMVAASAMHMDYGTQARMYGMLALAITGLVLGLVELTGSRPPGRGAGVLVAVSVVAAFHLHYFALHYVATAVGCAVLGCLLCGRGAPIKTIIVAVAAGAAACVPWAWFGLRHQLGHGLAPGGDDLGLDGLAQAYLHLFAHNVSFAGEPMRWLFVGGAALALGLAALGAMGLLMDRERRAQGTLLIGVAFGTPLLGFALASVMPRAGFTWHYFLPSVGAAAALVPFGAVGRRTTRIACALSLLCGTSLCALHLLRPATEDFEGAVRHALDVASDADVESPGADVRFVSVQWQPALFPQGMPFDFYAPRIWNREVVPQREPMAPGDYVPTPTAMEQLLVADLVIVVNRSLPADQPLRQQLRAQFGKPAVRNFGYGVDVLVYPAPPED